MAGFQREYSSDTDRIDVALAVAISIQHDYVKKKQEKKAALEKRRHSLNERRDALRNNIQRLREELLNAQHELQDADDEHKNMENEYIASEERDKQLYKSEIGHYIRMPSPPRERDEAVQEQTTPSRRPHQVDQVDDAGGQIEDEIIVLDSDSEGSSPVQMVDQESGAQANASSEEKVKPPESSDVDMEEPTGQQESPRRRVRIAEPLEEGDRSNAPPSKKPRRDRRAIFRDEGRASGRSKKDNKAVFRGIINPTVGEIYSVMQGPLKNGYAAVVLPTGDPSTIGISRSIRDTGLMKSIPACYEYNKQNMEILGWKKDYDDGGPRVTSREVPMMFFNDVIRIPQDGEFVAADARFEWVPVRTIRPLFFTALGSRPAGYHTAKKFRDRLTLLREEWEIQEQQIRCDNGSPGVSDTAANKMVQRTSRAASATRTGELQHEASTSNATHNTPRTTEINWNIRTLQSINQETPGFDATMDGSGRSTQNHDLLSLQEQMQQQLRGIERLQVTSPNARTTGALNSNDAARAASRESPDTLGEPEASTLQPTSRFEGTYGVSADATSYGLHSPTAFVPRRFEPVSSKSIPAIHTNLNDGDPDNAAGSSASTSSTQTMTEEPMRGARVAPETRGSPSPRPSSERAIPPGANARDTAAGALSFLDFHYNVQL
ncbi:hypothetical protein F5Y13DRAFT_198725 [Hypoxylon sp. FL1857]|nr:hypothetical protein F5Y13DRAFT_198725 [Hypoxylon sp. FL1857]